MAYQIEITSTALKTAKKLPKNIRRALIKKAQILKKNPLVGEKLKGKYSFLSSLHLSFKGIEDRVIYEFNKRRKKIYIYYAASRENLYRQLDKLKLKRLKS